MITKQEIAVLLEQVFDPEVPVLTVQDLGIVRDIIIVNDEVEIVISPTYSGCPAMHMIAAQIKVELLSHGIEKVKVTEQLSPAWTTDWMTESGKQKLELYGIAPPQYKLNKLPGDKEVVPCPQCKSTNTQLVSQYGSTACKALYKCNQCLEPFDYFKCH
ncbi:MAG: phenylacetate-CoA oxygenase subunit PaaJ [Bacteroidetes bacterium]|nr:phenylacetate-CoA oxygenase subunit PaaJ [Bacteroidota bacterium]